MTGRVVASVVALAAVGALAWVLLGSISSNRDDAQSSPTTSAPAEPATGSGVAEGPATAPADAPTPQSTATAVAANEPDNFGPRMDLVDLDGWLNTDATALSDFDGQVLVVEMWTFGCHNCKARIPFNQSYYQEFADENFEIIGVHAPEFSYEADVANIEAALVDLGVTWPVALDTEKKNFRAWQPGTRSFWPRTYVIDQNGDVRYDHIGEGKYEELRETIRYLLEHPPLTTAATDT